MSIRSPFTREFWIQDATRPSGIDLSPDFLRRVLNNPKCTVEQAAYSALALEQDRMATLRENLLRQKLELKEKGCDAAHIDDELDALRILETRT